METTIQQILEHEVAENKKLDASDHCTVDSANCIAFIAKELGSDLLTQVIHSKDELSKINDELNTAQCSDEERHDGIEYDSNKATNLRYKINARLMLISALESHWRHLSGRERLVPSRF